eukprot:TRINITY_DN62_c0_g1_i1.p1 TRINITY_DN62_c0_g1~~TRINITY_DN62_c0_g1_i1.p1  ORF type:complete len:401 (-),score=94.64 TRINITY_DN62_c0_g1_i1:119-1321(-)
MRIGALAGSIALLFVNLASRASAHSWVHCTEASTSLTITKNSDYSDSQCSGFPRNFKTAVQFNTLFGGDTGFNYQPSSTNRVCKDDFVSTSSSYGTGYPMATYTPGQKVRVIWPAKNHQADTCTNPYIPDTELKLYVNCGLAGTRNPILNDFLASSTLVIDWKANGMKGFQNCPDFCSNTDKAVCYEDFTVPSSLAVGSTCTFVWYWIFNSGTTPYTTCWEAQIVSGGGSTPAPTVNTPAPTASTPAPTASTPVPTASTPAPTTFAPAPTKAPSTSTTPAPTTSSGTCAAVWNQCGGKNFNGASCCSTGNKCVYLSDWYSQCWPNNWRADSIDAGQFSAEKSQETSTSTLILMFAGSAFGAAIVVLSVGGSVMYLRRRGRQVSQQLAGASEVLIPMQAIE